MEQSRLIAHAMALVQDYPDGLDGCETGNSVIGSVMSITLNVPRQYTEAACREAKFLLGENQE